jgi:hypothetical protein
MRPRLVLTVLLAILLAGCNLPTGGGREEGESPSVTSVSATMTVTEPQSQPSPESPVTLLSSTQAPIPINASIEVVGEEEMVYDWSADHCPDGGLPDLPVRLFRDAQGMIQLNLSSAINFRMIGESLDQLKIDCQPIFVSNEDPDPADFNFREWMGATYTEDGNTVYALIHNEYHGDDGSQWYAVRDFDSVQGSHAWSYLRWNGSSYNEMSYDGEHHQWQGSQPLCLIGDSWMHPDVSCRPTRAWTSPVNGTITISGVVKDNDPNGGNGVTVSILKGEQVLWSLKINNGDTQEQKLNLQVEVQEGDKLYFRLDADGDAGFDSTYFNPKVNLGPDPCPSNDRGRCLLMGITYAVSTDGGASFTQPIPPEHLVAALPYKYTPDVGQIAMWQPSNIVKSPKDGYYYALVQLDLHTSAQGDVQGMCVMRTQDLSDPKSWRAWDGEGYNLRFADPYEESISDPEASTCALVSQNTVGALTYNLSYNSYFEKFLAVGHGVNEAVPGFYFSLSDDLVHWSPKQLLMPADLAQTAQWTPPFLAYPALVDEDALAPNSDVTGQRPYMYFTRINAMSPQLDFDLLRVPLQLSK